MTKRINTSTQLLLRTLAIAIPAVGLSQANDESRTLDPVGYPLAVLGALVTTMDFMLALGRQPANRRLTNTDVQGYLFLAGMALVGVLTLGADFLLDGLPVRSGSRMFHVYAASLFATVAAQYGRLFCESTPAPARSPYSQYVVKR